MILSDIEKVGWTRPDKVWISRDLTMVWSKAPSRCSYLMRKDLLGLSRLYFRGPWGDSYQWVDGDWIPA